MFIQYAFEPDGRQFYFAVVISVIISVVLHELAHGWAAISRGDHTPQHTGHMTGNPLVHMGPISLAALFLCGIAWGLMPVDPTRLRGRHGEAAVAAAGPAMNLVLALAALTGLGLWDRYEHHALEHRLQQAAEQVQQGNSEGFSRVLSDESDEQSRVKENFRYFLKIFGIMNAALCVFNLIPVPPLDGSTILADFNRTYDTFVREKMSPGLAMLLFAVAFTASGWLIDTVGLQCLRYVDWLSRLG